MLIEPTHKHALRTKARGRVSILASTVLLASCLNAAAQTASPIQSSATPFGLSPVAPVMLAGSDAQSASFQQDVLPSITQFLNTKLGERAAVDDSGMLLDPSKLVLKTQADVRVYFIGEGAGYHNTLGFNTQGGSVTSGNPQLIFPDASSTVSTYNPAQTATRNTSNPLLPGDFVDLGTFAAQTQLDFFLIANGAYGGTRTYSTQTGLNPDGINHVVTFAYAMAGSPYLIIGFEDLFGGGDRDFNDLLFAIDIGAANVAALTATPEPATALLTLCLLGVVLSSRMRRGPGRSFGNLVGA